jgi:hypothetical protein
MSAANKVDTSDWLCPICGEPVKNVHNGGEGVTMWIERFNSKGERCGIRPPTVGHDQIHIQCMKGAPKNAHFPFFL